MLVFKFNSQFFTFNTPKEKEIFKALTNSSFSIVQANGNCMGGYNTKSNCEDCEVKNICNFYYTLLSLNETKSPQEK